MKKRIISLLVCLCLIFALCAGCAGGGDKTTDTDKTATDSTPSGTDKTAGNDAGASAGDGTIGEDKTVQDEGVSAGDISEDTVSARDSLVIGGAAEPGTLDPINQQSMIVSQMAHILYNTLFTLDANYNAVGDLVESYEYTSDTSCNFKIYEGVKFHDGTDLTTQDVKDTLEMVRVNEYSGSYVASIESIEIIDDYNFTINTSYPDTSLLSNLCQAGTSILPSEKLAEGWDFNANPCGSGPYQFVSWSKGDCLTFVRFDDYFKGTPFITNLTWRFIPESSSRTIALEAEEIDFIFDPATIDIATLDAEEGITVQGVASMNLMQLCFNYDALSWWSSEDVRRAFSYAIDREAIVAAALNGYGYPAYGTAPNGLAGENLTNSVTARDLDKAKELLASSGYDPSELSFTIMTTDSDRSLVAQVIKSNLADIGVEVTIELKDSATSISDSSLGNFQAYIQGVANTSAIDYIRRLYHSDQIGAQNCSRYSTDELDAEISRIASILDPEERANATYELEGELGQLCMYIPLYNDMAFRAYNSDLAGVNFNGAYFTQYHLFYWAA